MKSKKSHKKISCWVDEKLAKNIGLIMMNEQEKESDVIRKLLHSAIESRNGGEQNGHE